MIESLIKARESVDFAIGDLLEANKKANALEHLLILDQLDTARELQRKIIQLINAVQSGD